MDGGAAVCGSVVLNSYLQMIERQKVLEAKLQELQLEEQTLVKLGDASIASPFTRCFYSGCYL